MRQHVHAQRHALQRAVALLRSRRRHQRAAGLGQVHGHRRGGRGDRHGVSPACRSRRQHPAGLRLHLATRSSRTTATAATAMPAIRATGSTRANAAPAIRRRSRRAAGTARTWPARSPRVTNNSNGVAGVAFNARVVPARVLGKCGGYTSDIADAIIWTSGGTVSGVPANANPAKVLSISLGGGGAAAPPRRTPSTRRGRAARR